MEKTKPSPQKPADLHHDPTLDLLKEKGKEIFAKEIGSVYVDGPGFIIVLPGGTIIHVSPTGPHDPYKGGIRASLNERLTLTLPANAAQKTPVSITVLDHQRPSRM